MSWLVGLGDELTNFLLIVVSSIVLYLAWLSTNTRDEHIPNGSFVYMGARQRLISSRQVPVTVSVVRNHNHTRSDSTATETEEIILEDTTNSPDDEQRNGGPPIEIARPPSLQSILDEVGDLTGISPGTVYSEANAAFEREHIIQEMDRDAAAIPSSSEGIRHRRTHFHDSDYAEAGPSSRTDEISASIRRSNSSDLAVNIENCTNENSENGNVFDEGSATTEVSADTLDGGGGGARGGGGGLGGGDGAVVAGGSVAPIVPVPRERGVEFRIKLKYLNDELKLVKAAPEELIGDFKKRNFTAELSNNKIVRLVFNGHVLQPDSRTLLACGLFDNCVVHCLVHNPRPATHAPNIEQGYGRDDVVGVGGLQGEPMLVGNDEAMDVHDRRLDTGILLLSLIIVFGLYIRFQHIHLFTAYPIYGYALVLALFAIIFGIVYMVDRGTRMMYTGAIMLAMTMSFSYYLRYQHSNLFTFYSTVGLVLLTIMLVSIVSIVFMVQRNTTRQANVAALAAAAQQQQQQPISPTVVRAIATNVQI